MKGHLRTLEPVLSEFETAYTYTPEGQLLTRHWARGVDTTYTHDPASGEVTLIDYSDSTPDVSLSYDTRGRPSTITDGLGTRTLSYGTGSHLLADSLTGVIRSYTDGRLTGLNLGSDYGVTYGYDTYGRFGSINAQVAGTGAQTYTYGYLPNSDLLESLTTNHGLTVTRTYEPNRDVLTQVQNQFGTNIISQYDYTNDELAQRTSMTTSGTAFDPANPPTISPSTATYTTNNLNQYTSIQYPASSIQLTYDLDGNLIEDNIHHFTYDAENRLTSVTPITPTAGSKKVEFAYDYMSRRVEKQVYTYDGSSWVLETEKSFVYDGWNLIKEQTTEGGTTSTGYYVWGLDLSGSLQGAGGVGGLLSTTNSLTSQTFLYTFDANGNVGQLVDSSTGAIAAHYEYDPFGNLLVATGPEAANNVFRFSTKYYDTETDLYYYGHRYYSPDFGRWMTMDPIEEDGGINLYGFVHNDPINSSDLYGLTADSCPCCGPDITDSLVNLKLDALLRFYLATPEQQKEGCKAFCDPILNSGVAAKNWDMNWDKTVVPGSCPNGNECSDTVTVGSQCHNKWEVNYYLYGLSMSLCECSLTGTAKPIVTLQKVIIKPILIIFTDEKADGGWYGNPNAFFETSHALYAWVEAGYHFADPTTVMGNDDYENCTTCQDKGAVSIGKWPW